MGQGATDERLAGLRRWNLGLTVLHLAQAILTLMLAGDFAIAVTSSFPEGAPGTPIPAPKRSSTCGSDGLSRHSSASRRSIIC